MLSTNQSALKIIKSFVCAIVVLCSVASCVPVPSEVDAVRAEAPSKSIPSTPLNPTEQNLSPAEQHRWDATCGVTGGLVMRAEAVGVPSSGDDRLAGYLINEGSEQSLPEQLTNDFVSLVRAKDGFDDSIRKRCKPGLSVGFRLARSCAETKGEQQVSELVVDFGCNKLTIGDGTDEIALQAYFFDPSRSAFVDLVKRALPDDELLKSLND